MTRSSRFRFFSPEGAAAAAGGAEGTTTVEKPAEGEKPTAGEKPAEGEKPKEGEKPVEKKADGVQQTDDKGGKGAEGQQATPGAPEKYDLKLPEGLQLEDADVKRIERDARAANLTNDEANAFIETMAAELKAQSDEYLELTKKHPTLGGDNLAETQRLAKKGINFLRPEGHPDRDAFMRFVNRGGAFNHPVIVGALADLGRALSEDGHVGGNPAGGGGKQDTASKLYDHPSSKQAGT